MSRDARGWRCKFAVVAPSTNTIVQPDFDDLRPEGVTNHFGRIHIPNMPVSNDEDFLALVDAIDGALNAAVDRCLTCAPDHLIMGVSALMFWNGREASEQRMKALSDYCGLDVTAGSFACEAALNVRRAKRIAVLSPYQPVSDTNVTRFFFDCGFAVVRFRGLRCSSPIAIAEVSEDELRGHLLDLDGDDIDALVQVGTNLSMMRLAIEMEETLGKPVIAINSATYWQALRKMAIDDRFAGHGPLFEHH